MRKSAMHQDDGIPSILIKHIERQIYSDLAELYEVETKVFNQTVKRNIDRFPDDFMFRLTRDEWNSLRSQSVTSNVGRGGRRYPPRVFTQEGVAMLSSVLRSERAVRVNIEIMRAFVRVRQVLETNAALARKVDELAARVDKHDEHFAVVFESLRRLIEEPEKPRRKIGFEGKKR